MFVPGGGITSKHDPGAGSPVNSVHAAGSSYRGAAAHYLSPGRRDPVKRRWEEPVNHRIVASAIDRLPAGPDPLRVVDIGAGTGDGVALLEQSLTLTGHPGRPFHYIGIDPDPEMITTARALHRGRPDVEFVRADVRDRLPLGDVDLYLSAGVPYSHLTHTEFDDALTALFAATARSPHPTAVVLDVLGRYSIEWTPRWGSDQWNYDMSFFSGVDREECISAPMSFHSRRSLERAIHAAQRRVGIDISTVEYHDRSVVVGRHTTTAAFHPGLPNYRGMVNQLYDGDTDLELTDLELAVYEGPDGSTPAEVTAFFTALAERWNARLETARAREARIGPSADGRAGLADDLCALEHDAAQGLGTGHTLIGLVITNPQS